MQPIYRSISTPQQTQKGLEEEPLQRFSTTSRRGGSLCISSYQSMEEGFRVGFRSAPWEPKTRLETRLCALNGPSKPNSYISVPAYDGGARGVSHASASTPTDEHASGANPPRANAPDHAGPDQIDPDRTYRRGRVYGAAVPTAAVRALGLTTHVGTLRLETAALGLMSFLGQVSRQHHALRALRLRKQQLRNGQHQSKQPEEEQLPLFSAESRSPEGEPKGDGAPPEPDVSSETESPPPSRYQYINIYSGREHIVERRPGTVVKSMQGIAEDLYQRIYKRLPPAQDPLADPSFRSFYDRVVAALRRLGQTDRASTETGAPLLRRLGPAVPHANKLIRDRNGQRWSVHPGLLKGPPQSAAAVRSTGPEPAIDWSPAAIDPVRVAETVYAHRESLHTQFTAAWRSRRQSGRWTRPEPKHARRSTGIIAQRGSDYPSFISVGRWRKSEIQRRDRDSAVTVPWIIADVDTPSRYASDRYARTLCQLLKQRGLDLSGVIVSYTGGNGFHVRIPHSAVGCPIYQNEKAAAALIGAFFDRLCDGHPGLRTAIDDTAFRPRQAIRMIGSRRQNGRQCVGVSANEFLGLHPLVLFGHSDQSHYAGTTLPHPDDASYSASLTWLLLQDQSTYAHPIHQEVSTKLNTHYAATAPSSRLLKIQAQDSALPVNNYCWNPHYARPPPTGTGSTDMGVIERLLAPVAESMPWGEAVGRPYRGRNWAAFIVGLYVTSYPEVAAWRVIRGLRRRYGTDPGGHHGIGVGDTTEATAAAVLRAWNQAICRPPLPEAELMRTLKSARRYTTGAT